MTALLLTLDSYKSSGDLRVSDLGKSFTFSFAMPAFTLKNGRCFISCITGPSHVLLGLFFWPENFQPLIVRLPQATHCNHGPLDESRIRDAVIKGVAAAGVSRHIAEIVYCEGDSPRYDLQQDAKTQSEA